MKKGDIIQATRLNGEPYSYPEPILATVTWVIDGEVAAIDNKDRQAHYCFKLENCDWDIVVEAAPSYQSQVASLSDEQLRAAVDSMRSGRIIPTPVAKVKKEKAPALSEADKQFQALVAQLTPEEQAKLRIKMGLA